MNTPKVKKLQWTYNHSYNVFGLATYEVYKLPNKDKYKAALLCGEEAWNIIETQFDTSEEAKEACQRDFEETVLDCLETQ